MNRRKRILLLYISEHSGHHSASLAIEKALRALDASVDVLNINGFNYTNPILERVINRTYLGVIRRTPEIWDYLYDNPKVLKRVQGFREMIHRHNSGKLKELLDEFRPDVVACTQAFPCGMVADFKKACGLTVPLVGVVTDYVAHSYWVFDTVDFYVVPTAEVREKLSKGGIGPKKIEALGIPIDPDFARPYDRTEIARKLGLDLKTPVALVMGGGQGLGPIKKAISSLFRVGVALQVIAVAGTNKHLLASLDKVKTPPHCKLFIYGYTNNISELMAVSDVVITKPGGITTAEAISMGLPIIITNPLPGQEAKNTEFLLKSELALKVEHVKELPATLLRLLQNPAMLVSLKERCKTFAKPGAARSIAEMILSLAENYAHIPVIQDRPDTGFSPSR